MLRFQGFLDGWVLEPHVLLLFFFFRMVAVAAQKTDRAGEAANTAPRRQKSKAARDAVFFELFDEDTAGVPRPQERVQRHTVEHIVDFVRFPPIVQILDAPVPQTVTSCISTTRSHLIPSRLSKCPRSCPMMSLCEPLFAIRSWRNSWWKCRRSYPILPCSGLWSSTSTFQFLVVEGEFLVFKVFP